MTQAPVARGSPHTHAGLASRAAAKLQPPVPGVGSRVLCAGLGGRRRCPGQQPPAPRTPSPRASEVQPRGRVGTGVLRYTRPCRAAGKALLSPVEIKHRMGMGREGVWQQPAAGSGRGLGRGVLLCSPGGFACSAAPTYQGLHSTATRVGCPTAGSSEAPVVPVLRGARSSLQPQPRTRKHHVLGWTPGAGEKGARVTLPCLENMNLHVKVGVGPHLGHRVPWLWRQDHGAVQNGSGEGSGTRSSRHGASLGARSGGRQQVRSPGDVEIC